MTAQSDLDFFGLTTTALNGSFEFEVTPALSRMDHRLYGGTAIGVSVAAAQAVSQRDVLWMTTQFVSTVQTGTVMTLRAEILALGHRTHQLRVTGLAPDGSVVFASLGATGTPRPGGIGGDFEQAPKVTSPEESEPWVSVFSGMVPEAFRERLAQRAAQPDSSADTANHSGVSELRMAHLLDDASVGHSAPGSRVFVWARRRDGHLITPSLAAYVADMVPMAVGRALGVFAGGTSLDNTVRFGTFVESEWMLLDLRPHFAAGGYAHGDGRLWSPDGQLMGIASQTAAMKVFDPANPPWARSES